MHTFETIDLGDYRGHAFFLVGFLEPEPAEAEDYDPDEDAENYGVALADGATTPLEENTEILTMDTRHGRPHLDKEYLSGDAGAEKTVWLDQDYTYSRMKQFVLANWQHYVDRYLTVSD